MSPRPIAITGQVSWASMEGVKENPQNRKQRKPSPGKRNMEGTTHLRFSISQVKII
jgi:hypothetical protein